MKTTEPEVTFVGEDHPRYEEWVEAVRQHETLLGLGEWLEHQEEESDN